MACWLLLFKLSVGEEGGEVRAILKLLSQAFYWASCKLDCLVEGHRWNEVTKGWRFCTVCDKSEGQIK